MFDKSTGCQRKWGFKYLERLPMPQHPSAALGTEVHDVQLNPWLMEGRGFDFTKKSGEIAQAMAPLLPKPKTPGVRVKRWFTISSPSGGFGYQGELDLFAPDSSVVPGLPSSGLVLVGDFKTTGNFDWARTPEKLKTDVQAQLYALVIMIEDGVDELDLVWTTGRTRKPYRAQRAWLRVGASAPEGVERVPTSHVVEQFQRIDAIGRELVTVKLAKPKVEELPPNPRMCDAYGGCPFRYRCNLSPPVHAEAINREALLNSGTNSFLDRLKKNQTPTVTPAAASVPPPAPAPAPETPPAWTTAPVDPLVGKGALGHGATGPAPINPPEASLPPAPPVGAAAATAPAEAPKRRGRPPKSEQASATSAPAEASVFDVLGGLEDLAARMKAAGIKRLRLEGNMEIELT